MRRICVSAGWALLCAWVCYGQERFTHAPSGLSFVLPADWTYVQEGDHFKAYSPDESVLLFFLVGHYSEVEQAIVEAAEMLDKIIAQSEMTTEPTTEMINGLAQVYAEGYGWLDGERVDWDLTLVLGQKSMAIVAVGDIERQQAILNGIYASISE